MAKIITMGELMMRLSTCGYLRFLQSDRFEITFGGAEANVAVSLSVLGHEAHFVSELPEGDVGTMALISLQKYGVRVDHVVRGGDRLGIYFLEKGASMRPSKVIYDRANSSFANATADHFDFDDIFEGADWFHFTGITPALGKNAQAVTLAALKAAKKHGIKVSCDLNYRAKLWTKAEARKTLEAFMPYVDVCISNVPQIFDVFGIEGEDTLSVAQKTTEKFGFEYLLMTERVSHSASDNGWSAHVYYDNKLYSSKKYEIRIVDRVGGGDAFAAGFIHGLFRYQNAEEALEFATAASALAHTVEGDFNFASEAEVETLMHGDGTGRVQR